MAEPRPDKRMSASDRHWRRSCPLVHDRALSCTVPGRATPYSRPPGESVQGFRNEQPIAITLATRNRLAP